MLFVLDADTTETTEATSNQNRLFLSILHYRLLSYNETKCLSLTQDVLDVCITHIFV